MALMQYLIRRRGKGLALRVAKPKALWKNPKNKEFFVQGLETRDIHEAQPKKRALLAQLWLEWEKALGGPEALLREGLEWAQDHSVPDDIKDILLEGRAEAIQQKHGYETAKRFYDVAKGAITFSLAAKKWAEHEEAYGKLKKATFEGDKKEHAEFAKWANDPPLTKITRSLCSEYVREVLLKVSARGGTPAPATVRRKITSLSKVFKFADLTGLQSMENPFRGLHALAKGGRDRGGSAKKRPLKYGEAKAWLTYVGEIADPIERKLQSDLLMLLIYTGARYSEIALVDKTEVNKDGQIWWIEILEGKTDAAPRKIPIAAPQAKAILARRMKEAGVLLFPETANGQGKAIGKRLRTSRDNALPEVCSVLDVHSTRRMFITAADECGVETRDLERLVGHKQSSATLRMYSSAEGRKRLIATIKEITKEISRGLSRAKL